MLSGEKPMQLRIFRNCDSFIFQPLLRRVPLFLCSAGIVLSLANPACAQNQDEREKRSMIQEINGFSYLSEDKTISELRQDALDNAKQQALSNASTYIRSRTEVEDFVLKRDEVLLNAEGTVKVLEQKDNGIQDNSRYHIWIRAEVEYLLGDPGNQKQQNSTVPATDNGLVSPPSIPSASAPLTVKVWADKNSYTKGEKISIHIKGNRSFYARIVDINGDGNIIQLLPNDYRRSSFFEGGTTYTIPNEEDRFDLSVSPPYGTDKIIVYASEDPLGETALTPIGQGLNLIPGDQQALGVATRGIAVTPKTVADQQFAIAEYVESSFSIQTSDK